MRRIIPLLLAAAPALADDVAVVRTATDGTEAVVEMEAQSYMTLRIIKDGFVTRDGVEGVEAVRLLDDCRAEMRFLPFSPGGFSVESDGPLVDEGTWSWSETGLDVALENRPLAFDGLDGFWFGPHSPCGA